MIQCPEIRELAAFVETQVAGEGLRRHLQECDACQEAIQELEEEVLSLQIPLTEIWFREHISCPHQDILIAYQQGTLDHETREYVKFHVEDMACQHCQSRAGVVETTSTHEGRRFLSRSRRQVGEATSVLLRSMREGRPG